MPGPAATSTHATGRRGGPLATLAAATALTLATSAPAGAGTTTDPEWLAHRLAAATNTDAILDTLRTLEHAAAADGSREAGTSGFTASVRLFADRLRHAGYQVSTQDVPYRAYAFDTETLTPTGSDPVRILMAHYSVSTPPGGVTATLVPVDPAAANPTAGCAPTDYPPTIAGAVALVRTGGCISVDKAKAAATAGAAAIVLYDITPSAPWTALRRRATGAPIPMGFVSQTDADTLNQRAASGPLPATLELRGREFDAVTTNLFAETTGGRADHVIMAGAHLDSGHDGPGINDNGTSAAALLETALRLAPHQRHITNRVRFAFWGAEELVNLGSTHYVQTLTPAQADVIRLYLNYEMIASPNFVRFVMDGDDSDHTDTGLPAGPAGSAQVEAVVAHAYTTLKLPYTTVDLGDVRSDNEAFMTIGIPVGGAHGGSRGIKTTDEATVFGGTAGQFYDPCYHQPCDNVTNVNRIALGQVPRTIAFTVGRFAIDDSDIPARG